MPARSRCRKLSGVPSRDATPAQPAPAQPASPVEPSPAAEPEGDTASVVRKRSRGVTVLPSAEGRSLRSDPRWTTDGARRADRLLERLVALRRRVPARG